MNQYPRGNNQGGYYGANEHAEDRGYGQQPGIHAPLYEDEATMGRDGESLANADVATFVKKVYLWFAFALLTATGAAFGGTLLTEHFLVTGDTASFNGMRIGALAAFFISYFAVFLMRKTDSPLKRGMFFIFASAAGFMVAPAITYAIASGMGLVPVWAFGIATVTFFGLSVYVHTTGKDFRFLGTWLFAGLLVLLGAIILNIFVPFPNAISRLITIGVLVLFVGYTLYDTSKVTRDYYWRKDFIGAALMLFYDFFILFYYTMLLLMGNRR